MSVSTEYGVPSTEYFVRECGNNARLALAAAVDRLGIGEAGGDDLEALGCGLGEETASVAFMAGGAGLLDFEQDCVGVAIDKDGCDDLGVAALFTFGQEAAASATVINGPTSAHGFVVGLGVHPGDHEHLAGRGVLGHGGDKAVIFR